MCALLYVDWLHEIKSQIKNRLTRMTRRTKLQLNRFPIIPTVTKHALSNTQRTREKQYCTRIALMFRFLHEVSSHIRRYLGMRRMGGQDFVGLPSRCPDPVCLLLNLLIG
uniref:Uncharacterized protein n=1 Tax=Aegilops tauschii subsp. strangulata TaxID=200361 RepID=A0A453F092_AEGTS